jgi:hypothetical protein
MRDKKTRQQTAKKKTPSAKAGKYVHEEIGHVRQGKHGARALDSLMAIAGRG